ncbi:hypothetical protein D3C85_1709430 [compost metagenome]
MMLQQELKILLVFFCNGRQADFRSWKVNAFPAADHAPDPYSCRDPSRLLTCHLKLDFPVID